MTLRVGDKAPDFELRDQHGASVRLSTLLGQKPVVLFFYPKDDSPICTREVCAFRDAHAGFAAAGAEVLGISMDGMESHNLFSSKHALPYRILSDEKKDVLALYGVKTILGFMPERVTFVIGKDGVIRHVYSAMLRGTKHAEEALAALRKIT
ncbi:MAG: peroxiredoxin [Nitrospinae bacterium]|nr:peroxiredoxin [Nitrospinota bacterium]